MKVLLAPISVHERSLVQGPDPVTATTLEVWLEIVFGPLSVVELDFGSGKWSSVVAGHLWD